MKKIINGKLYDTETSEAIADNEFRDGSNRMNCGRRTTLYKTKKGCFFAFHETCWQGEHYTIEPLDILQAKRCFEEISGDPDDWPTEFGEPEEA